ncbi:shikimate kinase [Pareuzebyella sediminis]|uniref:shikimate kinase n=1 Tax=Pareuzebyella sediminis TaxID=2607998 RepID=UPI0011F06400|nr:shikimate kinase [Pareuzebyella sediminis]
MKIVLLGYMGSGKTTVGKEVAKRMELAFLDLDAYIESSEKMSIPEIFNQKGELYFRKKEHQYLQEVLREEDNIILSTGGGTPCYVHNLDTIYEHTDTVVYVKVSIEELVRRLAKEKAERPLIRQIADTDLPEFIRKHLFERAFYYNQARYVVVADGKSPQIIAEEIEKMLD